MKRSTAFLTGVLVGSTAVLLLGVWQRAIDQQNDNDWQQEAHAYVDAWKDEQ